MCLIKNIYVIYLFLVILGLQHYMWACSSCDEQGLLFLAVGRLLIVVASRCKAQALGYTGSVVSCGTQAELPTKNFHSGIILKEG